MTLAGCLHVLQARRTTQTPLSASASIYRRIKTAQQAGARSGHSHGLHEACIKTCRLAEGVLCPGGAAKGASEELLLLLLWWWGGEGLVC